MIQVLNLDSTDHLTYGHILKVIRTQVAALSSVEFIFNTRHCNVVADALAKKAKNCRETRVQTGFMPEDIASLVVLTFIELFSHGIKAQATDSLVSQQKKK